MKKGQENIGMIVIFGMLIFLGIILLAIGFDVVEPSHLGIKVNLGSVDGIMEPGIQWTGFFTHTYLYDMRIRQARVEMANDATSATDKDGQAVYGIIRVNYRIKQDKNVVEQIYRNVGQDEGTLLADKLNIPAIIKEGFKQATVQYEALDILSNRQQVKELAVQNIKRNFPSDYFELTEVVVEDLDFSQEFKDAIEAKKTATQNKLREQEQVEVVKLQQQQEIEKYKAEAEKLKLQKNEVSELLIKQKLAERWDGKLPNYVIVTGENQGMFLQVMTDATNGTKV